MNVRMVCGNLTVYVVDFNLSSKLVPRFMIEFQALTSHYAGPRSVLITQIMP